MDGGQKGKADASLSFEAKEKDSEPQSVESKQKSENTLQPPSRPLSLAFPNPFSFWRDGVHGVHGVHGVPPPPPPRTKTA